MILNAEYKIELNNGKIGTRKGPLYIPDTELLTAFVDPLFTTKNKKYSLDQCILTIPVKGSYIVDYNIHELETMLQEKFGHVEVKGYADKNIQGFSKR